MLNLEASCCAKEDLPESHIPFSTYHIFFCQNKRVRQRQYCTCAWSSAYDYNKRSSLLVKFVDHLVACDRVCTKTPALHHLEENLLKICLQANARYCSMPVGHRGLQ